MTMGSGEEAKRGSGGFPPSHLPGFASSLRRVANIARGEAQRTGGSFNRKTLLLLAVLGLAFALAYPHVAGSGIAFDKGLYRASATSDAALLPAAEGSWLFAVTTSSDPVGDVQAGRADIAILADRVYAPDTSKGNAALAALKQAAKDYTFANLALEPDQAAAFPVRVELVYAPQVRAVDQNGGVAAPSIPTSLPTVATPGGSGAVGGGSSGGQSDGAPVTQKSTSGFSFLPAESSVNTPETLTPPFPFRSLLLAYVFLIPMNFVVQIYAGSAINERLQRKGEAMLASPARPWEIIAGKALPYLALMLLISTGIVFWIRASWLSLVAVAPLCLAFLALEFVSAMFARSFRELTFLTVFTSVLLTIYAFLPAVFTSVHPIALVSPIALVVFDLRHDPVTLAQVLYATLPLTIFSLILFLLGAQLYQEEDLFHQKPVLAKAVDAVARLVRGLGSGVKLSFLLIPLVFVFELLLVTFLFAWPVKVGVIGVMLAVALVEETFKGLPSYAAVRRGRVPVAKAALFGAFVGLGFFLAEKLVLVASVVGLLNVPAAAAVFNTGLSAGGASASPLVLVALLVMPLALHVGTASITGWGAKSGGRVFGLSFLLAVAVHAAYDITVLQVMGGFSL
jgi:ABC-type Na+ efflux pump permease subunit